jgi:2-C-methyl-D-erythritol 4-phosphate cytidylyltransferase / 2-C-methyl-D-erythritol 2,4-cyclodiphosphate synthase
MASTLETHAGSDRTAAILVAAGKGLRAGPGELKQFRSLGGVPLLARSVRPFVECGNVSHVVLVVPDPAEARVRLARWLPIGCAVSFVGGGATRQESTAAGLRAAGEADIVLVHDGARPFVDAELIRRVLGAAREQGAAVPLVPFRETLKKLDSAGCISGTADREAFALAQTPQGFRRSVLEAALSWAVSQGFMGTDEAEIVEKSGHPVARVEGTARNLKLTTPEDFEMGARLLPDSEPMGGLRVGLGYDVHALVPGRPLVLGGVRIPHEAGPAGHSDGDLVCHAATDALLGAAGLPDIGQLFPDTDPAYAGVESLKLLADASQRARQAGFRIVNLDVVLVAEAPRLVPHLGAMKSNLAQALHCSPDRIGIKGKRGEGLGFEGRREGMAAHAVALVSSGGGIPGP